MTNRRYEEQKAEYERQHKQCDHNWKFYDSYTDGAGCSVSVYICSKCGEESEERSW